MKRNPIYEPALQEDPGMILERLMGGDGSWATLRSTIQANQATNWFAAVAANAFAKRDAGAGLTELEQTLVDSLSANDDVRQLMEAEARLFSNTPDDIRSAFYPGKFSNFTIETSYDFPDLAADMPELDQQFLGKPNVLVLDVDEIHAQGIEVGDEIGPDRSAVISHGGALVAALSREDSDEAAAAWYTIKAVEFTCFQESPGIFWSDWGDDEAYWIFRTDGGTPDTRSTFRSHNYSVNSGDTRRFRDDDGWLWPVDGFAGGQPMAGNEISMHIELWEADFDDEDANRLRDIVDGIFTAANLLADKLGAPQWVKAVIEAAKDFTKKITVFLDCDFINHWTWSYTRQTLESRLQKRGGSFVVSHPMTNADADYSVTVRAMRTQ
jgi:hypothetical protein